MVSTTRWRVSDKANGTKKNDIFQWCYHARCGRGARAAALDMRCLNAGCILECGRCIRFGLTFAAVLFLEDDALAFFSTDPELRRRFEGRCYLNLDASVCIGLLPRT